MEVIKVKCIKHRYEDQTEVKVCGLTFRVEKGEKVAIIGPNGSGKTTLLHHIIGLLKPIRGEIKVFGLSPYKNFKKLIPKIGVVFQDVDYQLFGPTVFDDIAFVPRNLGWSEDRIRKEVNKILKDFGIQRLKNKVPSYLSGGEKKKVAIAGAIVSKPELLILDEALAEVDPESKEVIIKKLNKMNKELQTTILLVTNEIEVIKKFADVVYLMEKGRIILKAGPKELFKRRTKIEFCKHF